MASDPRNRSPRPGFVLNVDKQTPPLLFHHGDNFGSKSSRPIAPG